MEAPTCEYIDFTVFEFCTLKIGKKNHIGCIIITVQDLSVLKSCAYDKNCTFQFNVYTIISKRRPLRFRICDCRGFEDAHGVDLFDIEAILDGNVKNKYTVMLQSFPLLAISIRSTLRHHISFSLPYFLFPN